MNESKIIIFFDIVGYSLMNESNQGNLFLAFQRELHYILYQEINNFQKSVTLIPTGDGVIIGLNTNEKKPHIKSLEIVAQMFQWSKKAEIGLRASIHCGNVLKVKDINFQENIVGNSINDASRMIGGADKETIVISKDFFRNYLQNPKWERNIFYIIQETKIEYKILDESYIIDKHDISHNVMSIELLYENDSFGSKGLILSKYFTNIYSSEYSKIKNLNNDFKEKVKKCSELNLIGIYHPNTYKILSFLENVKQKVKVNIYFAHDDLKEQLETFFEKSTGNLDFANKKGSILKIKEWVNSNKDKTNIKVKIFEYQDPPSFGASTIDFDTPEKGFIHISNYIKGILPEETPYLELYWKTRDKPPLYEFYQDYLKENILNKCEQIY